MKMKKRLVQVLIAFLLVNFMPASAFAASEPRHVPTLDLFGTLKQDATVKFVIKQMLLHGMERRAAQAAQENKSKTTPAKDEKAQPPAAEPVEANKANAAQTLKWPVYGGMSWNSLGEEPLVPAALIPGYGQGDEEKDMQILHAIVSERPGYEEASKLFWAGVSKVFFAGGVPDPFFVNELKEAIASRNFTKIPLVPSQVFRCRMAFGGKDIHGKWVAEVRGIPMIMFDEPTAEAYAIGKGIIPRTGPYAGLPVSVAIPKECLNITCTEGADVTGKYPSLPMNVTQVPMSDVVFVKERKNHKGKDDGVPSPEVERWGVTLKPKDGGPEINLVSFDNKTIKTRQPIGKKFTAIERYNKELFEAEQSEQDIQISQDPKLNIFTFRNVRILQQTEKKREKETEKNKGGDNNIINNTTIVNPKKGHKKLWTGIGILAGGLILCGAKFCRGDDIDIYAPPRK